MKKKGVNVAKGKKVKKSPAKKKAVAKKTPVKKVKAKASSRPAKKSVSPARSAGKKVSAAKTVAKARSSNKAKSTSIVPVKKSTMKWTEFVTPLDDRVMVQITEPERRTAGGLYIPDTASDISGNKQGIAVAVGRGHRDAHGKIRPMDVQIGDKVIFAEYAGSKIELLGETLILLRESEVMGILTA